MDFVQLAAQHPTEMAAVVGVAMLLIGQLVKKTGMEGKYVATILCVLIGLGYTAFTTFVPVEAQSSIVSFASTSFTTSWALYELAWKPVRNKMAGV